MSDLRLIKSISPTISGVIVAAALGGLSEAHACQNFHNQNIQNQSVYEQSIPSQFTLKKTPKTFSNMNLYKSESIMEIDNLMLSVFEKISKDSKPLDEKFAKLLSDNILDLF